MRLRSRHLHDKHPHRHLREFLVVGAVALVAFTILAVLLSRTPVLEDQSRIVPATEQR